MEIARILRELWRLKLWVLASLPVVAYVALGTAYRVSLLPPDLQTREVEVGAAATELLIDSPNSALIDVERPVESLTTRAQVYASLVDSEIIRDYIAEAAGLPGGSIVTSGPSAIADPRGDRNAEQRANELIAEKELYRISSRPRVGLPVISIDTQAPTAEGAAQLADAAAKGLSAYVSDLQTRQSVPAERRIEIRQLGSPRGGLINAGAATRNVVLAFIALLAAACGAILFLAYVIRSLREGAELERQIESLMRTHPDAAAPRAAGDAGSPDAPPLVHGAPHH